MTYDDADRLMDIAISGLDRKKFRKATLLLENVAANCPYVDQQALATYNLGVIFWSAIGDGEAARKHFIAAEEMVRMAPPGTDRDEMQCWRANACENMMLLSLSFDEYEQWAAKLETIEPTNDILRGQRPLIRNYRDEGKPWSAMMFLIAQTYYNRSDPSKDRGRYACALSTFRLMLGHRKALRLNRDDWGVVTYEAGALAMRTVSDCLFALRKRDQSFDHSEFNFITKVTLQFVEEYVEAYPDEQDNSSMLANLRGFIQAEEGGNNLVQAELPMHQPPSSNRPAHQPRMTSPRHPGRREPWALPLAVLVFIGCTVVWAGLGGAIGTLVDWAAGTENGKFWGMGVCAVFAGLIVVIAFVAQKMARGGSAAEQAEIPIVALHSFENGQSPDDMMAGSENETSYERHV